MIRRALIVLLVLNIFATVAAGQERTPAPYFVAYDHYMEELDTLEIRTDVAVGQSSGINSFLGNATEFEYGATRWWTPEVYLDWQHTQHEGSLFTGFRVENRFRLFVEPHKINPVVYIEYEHVNGADKVIKEVVGFDGKAGFRGPNNETRREHDEEIEPRLILSSQIGEWNLTGNAIGEKNVQGGPWEFGYAAGVSKPLRRKFAAGIEFYGGLGTTRDLTLSGTAHYIAPVFLWNMPGEVVLQVSPGWGLTHQSLPAIFRVGISRDIDDVRPRLRKLFRL